MSDDEDLLTAYDVAAKELQGNLKLQVSINKKHTETPETTVKEPKKSKKSEEKKSKKTVRKTKKETSSNEVAMTPTVLESDTPSSEREDEEEDKEDQACQTLNDQGKHSHSSKNNTSLPPRNAIKKLIVRELEKHAPQIFSELVKCKDLSNNGSIS